jgi:hypothetical protein
MIKNTLFRNWGLNRIIRLVLGLIITYQAIIHKDPVAGLLAFFLLFQSVTNTGCCGSSCAIPSNKCETTKK